MSALVERPLPAASLDSAQAQKGEGARSEAPAQLGEKRLEAQLRVAFATSIEALLVVDDARCSLRVNKSGERLLGVPASEIVGRRVEDFSPRERWPEVERLWQELRARGVLEGDWVVLRGDGSLVPVTFRASWRYAPGEHLIAALEAPPWPPTTRAQPPEAPLTGREREILYLASEGKSTPRIAEQLFLSPATVKTHFANIYEKLGVYDRAAAVAAALRRGLIF